MGRAQRVTVNGVTLGWRPVASGVPQGSILGPVLFNLFVNYLDAGLERILINFADYTELGGAVDTLEGREALQRELESLGSWAIPNCMKLNKGKCRILPLGHGKPGCTDRLGNEGLESSSAGRDLGVLVDSKLNMSHQRALAAERANHALGGIEPCIAAGRGRGLSRSAPCWGSLTSSAVGSVGCHRTLRV